MGHETPKAAQLFQGVYRIYVRTKYDQFNLNLARTQQAASIAGSVYFI